MHVHGLGRVITTGYIAGSTKTGTAVTVAASELVSGSETKTENGTEYEINGVSLLSLDFQDLISDILEILGTRTRILRVYEIPSL